MSSVGAYEIIETKTIPEITLIASGSEVQIAIDAQKKTRKYKYQFKSSFYAVPGIVR